MRGITSGSLYQKLIFTVGLAFFVSISACSTSKTQDDGSVPSAEGADENTMGDSDSGQASGLKTINFPYDSFLLDSTAKGVLASNASLLKGSQSMNIQVEGHCDSRGGIQYNLALGEKRARAVKNYLVDQGVAASRIEVISFGKERPVDSSENEAAWAKNRRANFVVTSR